MSDASEKPFEATPQRIAKAKREGNVARSSELGANLSFAAAAGGVIAIVPVVAALAHESVAAATTGAPPYLASVTIVAVATIPILLAALAAAVAGFAQSGGFHLVAPSFKLERLNPVEGVKRVFSTETLAHTGRAALAFVIAAGTMFVAIAAAASEMTRVSTTPAVAAVAWRTVREVSFSACATGSLFALAEYLAARTAWLRKLRMSLEERRREAKEQDGDPLARSRRRSLHRALARSAIAKVKDASFVVTNPTHVAVALEYRPPEVPVPRILVRALDEKALTVRALAVRHGVPIVENVALARALYRETSDGEVIPVAHYVAVAEVVAALVALGKLDP